MGFESHAAVVIAHDATYPDGTVLTDLSGAETDRRGTLRLRTLLDELPEGWTRVDEGPDTWTPREVVAHLIHGERTDWIPRARIIIKQGSYRRFDPFDRFAEQSRELPDAAAHLRSRAKKQRPISGV